MHEPSFFTDFAHLGCRRLRGFLRAVRAELGAAGRHAGRAGGAVRAELEEAQRLRQEAEALLADAAARREAALKDAAALLAGAKAEAARLAAAAEEEARLAAERRERMALDRIAAAEKAAVDDVRHAAAEIAAAAAARVIRQELTAQDDGALIDRAIGRLAGALGHRAA